MRSCHSNRSLVVLTQWIAVVGCTGIGSVSNPKQVPTGQIKFDVGYEDTVKESINLAIPVGTSVAEAKRIFEESGCECAMETINKKERLRCSHSRQHGVWVTIVWQIFGSVEDGQITDLNCRSYGIGP